MERIRLLFGGGERRDGDGKVEAPLVARGRPGEKMSRGAAFRWPPGFTISTEVCNIYFAKQEGRSPLTWTPRSTRRSAVYESRMGNAAGAHAPVPAPRRSGRRSPRCRSNPSPAGPPSAAPGGGGYLARPLRGGGGPRPAGPPATGAKETIFHLPMAFAGDLRRRKVVLPDPGYPTYEAGARFAGSSRCGCRSPRAPLPPRARGPPRPACSTRP